MAATRPPDNDDTKNVNLTEVHNLSGPVAVEGAEPGIRLLGRRLFMIVFVDSDLVPEHAMGVSTQYATSFPPSPSSRSP